MKNKTSKWLITLAFAGVFLALSMAGGTWKIGLAQSPADAPTIPVVAWIEYNKPVYAGRPDLTVTFSGNDFIDSTYTKVRWDGPDGTTLYLDPVYVGAGGTRLVVIVPNSALMKAGIARLCVVNHPDAGMIEVSQIYDMQITGRLFLPIIGRK